MTQGIKNSTLKKEQVKESKLLTTGVKSIKFWHEAQADGETSIPFGSLQMPAAVAANGESNPSSSTILAANLALFKNNVEVFSSFNQKLMLGLSYVVHNNQIKFVNGYESIEGEIFEVTYKNDVITGTNVVDARPLTSTGVLTAGTTDYTVGEAFKTNAFPSDQLGEVLVFLDGVVQYRNVANATAAPAADGNYEEVHAAGGYGTVIRFNDTFPDDMPVIVISRNLIAERADVSMMQLIEVLGTQLDNVIDYVAATAGVDPSIFRTAANQIDLAAFSAQVTANKNKLADTTTIEVPIVTEWTSWTPTGTMTTNTAYFGRRRRVGDTMEIEVSVFFSGAPNAVNLEIDLPAGITIDSGKQWSTNVRKGYGTVQIRDASSGSHYDGTVRGVNQTRVQVMWQGSAATTTPVDASNPVIFANDDSITINAKFPVLGWAATQTVTILNNL